MSKKFIAKIEIIPLTLFSLIILTGIALAQVSEINLKVGDEVFDGYNRIFFDDGPNKNYISTDKYNDYNPKSAGNYLVWSREINGQGQIFRLHIPTKSILQLTHFSNNLNPVVDKNGRVAWEHWDGNGWQIFLFDGIRFSKISSSFTAVLPYFSNNNLIYSVREKKDGLWALQGWDLETQDYIDLPQYYSFSSPDLVDRSFFYNGDYSDKVYSSKREIVNAVINKVDWVDSQDIEEELAEMAQVDQEVTDPIDIDPQVDAQVGQGSDKSKESEVKVIDSGVFDPTPESSSSTQQVDL